MKQKTKALKASSKIIAVIAKICYSAAIVAIVLCLALLMFIVKTGGNASAFKIGESNFIIYDAIALTPAETASICAVLFALCCFLFAIFKLTYNMFHEISLTGDPFTPKHVNAVRAIGILTAAMPVIVGIVESIATALAETEIPDTYTDMPGIVVGAVIFCLSYIIDYGCGLNKPTDSNG